PDRRSPVSSSTWPCSTCGTRPRRVRVGRPDRPASNAADQRVRTRRGGGSGLAERQPDGAAHPGAADAAVAVGVLVQVLLVVVLRQPEVAERGDLGGDRAVAGGGEPLRVSLPRRLRGLALGVTGVVDRRAVLGADVVALTVPLGGVVVLPEDPQQVGVGDL